MSNNRTNYHADIVIPCFQEKDALPHTVPKLVEHFRTLVASADNRLSAFWIFLVDDGSSDTTWEVISALSRAAPEVKGIKLSRNYGHQMALMAGLSRATADAVITMDADLQDDISAVAKMLLAYEKGAHLVLGVRVDRRSDSRAKRGFANAYYCLLAKLGVKIVANHADFRLMSKQSLAALLEHQEVNLFLRGIIPSLGFSVELVPYTRMAREQGETKYTARKMIKLAVDGITSFSVVPLRMIALVGALVFLGSAFWGTAILLQSLMFPESVVPGWTSTILPLLALSGVQILSLGVLGEYVGKIYMEVKRRPRFLIEEDTEGQR